MPDIFRQVSNYQGTLSGINTTPDEATLRCRKVDLYRSIVTVGNPSFISWQRIRQLGLTRALYESIFEKAALVAVNIQSSPNGLRRHKIFDTYVTDKKRAVSYNLGMAFAKFYSEQLIGIPSLIHIEFLKKMGAVTFVPQGGNLRSKEPDLVGQAADGNWHIFEAKGVSGSETQLPAKVAEAKHQIQQVATIHGARPASGSACATYIGDDRILTRLEDPPAGDRKRIEINRDKFYGAYYAPFLLARDSKIASHRTRRIDGLDVDFFELKKGSQKIQIGLESETASLVLGGIFDLPQQLRHKMSQFSALDGSSERYSIGLDGFVIRYELD